MIVLQAKMGCHPPYLLSHSSIPGEHVPLPPSLSTFLSLHASGRRDAVGQQEGGGTVKPLQLDSQIPLIQICTTSVCHAM